MMQIWDPERQTILRSVQCAERCILYSLAFHGRSFDELVVASGTVFQQILLWNPMEKAGQHSSAVVAPVQRLHAHDGVLFKLAWSSDASFLVSVSDDRTVQLWSKNVTTDAEKVQQPRTRSRSDLLQKQYASVFRAWGHSARIWDVSFWERGVVTASEDGVAKLWNFNGTCVATLQGHVGKHVWRVAVHPSQTILATGGGDGAVKLWDSTQQLMSSTDASVASDLCQTIRVPFALWQRTTKTLASHSVRNIVLRSLDRGKIAFVASEHGAIFRMDLLSLRAELIYALPWTDTHPPPARLSSFSIDCSGRYVLLGEVSGRVSIVEATTGTQLYSWTTQTNVRVMKIWWDQHDALFVSSANGLLTEWKPLVCDSHQLASITMNHVASYTIPAKSSISTILIVDRAAKVRNIIGGDGHGNVYVFHHYLPPTEGNIDVIQGQSPAFTLKGVHGRSAVTSLLLDIQKSHMCLVSGGHDGYICSYELEETSNSTGKLSVTRLGREAIKGLSTIKQMWWRQSSGTNQRQELFVFGFHATHAILHNMSAQYRVFTVDCGGWRRPHALYTQADNVTSAIPSHTFVFAPPTSQRQDIEVKIHSTLLDPCRKPPLFLHCSLHDQYHGRMTVCVAFLGTERLVTASEDNSVLLHRRLAQDEGKRPRWRRVASGIAHTSSVRVLTTYQRNCGEDHIVVSGGGKQRLNVWLVSGEQDVLRHVCGYERREAAQDHRILTLATFAIPCVSNAYRLVTACNSEGSIQLLVLDLSSRQLLELGECRSSRKPILSCVGFEQVDSMMAGLAVGSTDGFVTLWNLSMLVHQMSLHLRSQHSVEQLQDSLRELISHMRPVGNYLAHEMGTNSMTLVSCSPSAIEQSLDVAIVSGGDDQNLTLCALRFPSCHMLSETRIVNASGSAIKTLACGNAQRMYAAGYDQRVSKWHMERTERGYDLTWQGAAFSDCADIADMAIRPSWNNAADDVVVVGQGLQMMQFEHQDKIQNE
ncbi:hypothetical protein PsorP6_004129 [Peronosclerospora sorghi]|uniref:Uncharacterized protein n=1 Tax=Peronosclerospora sorghi TaxID=230839 RepID=A0ACC0VN93_9STRA|nr:hypothetical protein PsorP6_004129 [Peronosclerospora sorghi]